MYSFDKCPPGCVDGKRLETLRERGDRLGRIGRRHGANLAVDLLEAAPETRPPDKRWSERPGRAGVTAAANAAGGMSLASKYSVIPSGTAARNASSVGTRVLANGRPNQLPASSWPIASADWLRESAPCRSWCGRACRRATERICRRSKAARRTRRSRRAGGRPWRTPAACSPARSAMLRGGRPASRVDPGFSVPVTWAMISSGRSVCR